MVRLRAFIKALAGIDEPLPDPLEASDADTANLAVAGGRDFTSQESAPVETRGEELPPQESHQGDSPAELHPELPPGAHGNGELPPGEVPSGKGHGEQPSGDEHSPPIGNVLSVFGVRRERDLDSLTAPPRLLSATLQLLICAGVTIGVVALYQPIVQLAIRLDLPPTAAPVATAAAATLLTLLAALRLGSRIRHAERRRLFLRFRSRWNHGDDPARAYLLRTRSPSPR